MKSNLTIIYLLIFCNSFCQQSELVNENLKREVPDNYEINQVVSGKFDDDNLNDYLLILSNIIEKNDNLLANRDSLTKRKVILLKGLLNNKFKKIYENDNLVPCRECGGKSDNLYDILSIKKGIFTYRTCNAPFAQDSYRLKTFKLEFDGNNFKLIGYNEIYYQSPDNDDEIMIDLNQNEIIGRNSNPFNFYNWNWLTNNNLKITKSNLIEINNIAYAFYLAKNYNDAIFLLNKIIEKFPYRIVAYINLADNYWEINDKNKAILNYKKYIQLMKDQKKDLKKIPKYVYQRIK